MKNTKYIYILIMATLAMVGCQKENSIYDGQLRLVAEKYGSNTKVSVNGNVSEWVPGDEVYINGQTVSVTVDDAGASVSHPSGNFEAPFYGVYPASIYSSNEGSSFTLNLPASYTYSVSGGNQTIGSPMVAYAAQGNELFFKHITAAIGVKITNDFGIDVRVTNITISSNNYKLNGSTTVDMTNINVAAATAEGEGNASKRQVQMTFGGDQLKINSGSSAIVQIPVLPVGNDNRFTISVTVQNWDDADMEYTFSKTQAGEVSGDNVYNLGRAEIGYAPAKFGGVFTVASGKQVRFAPGNLQYYLGSVSEGVSRWSFKTHQYDRSSSIQSGYYSTNTTQPNKEDYIDLFGWGASGIVGSATRYLPWQYAWSGSFREDVGDANLPTNVDWGYNAIKNGGNVTGRWRTLTSAEWAYLWNTRIVEGYVNSVSRATVEGVQGIIILPDNFVDPQTNTSVNYTSFYPGPNTSTIAGFTDNVYSGVGWAAMQTAGVIFLPVCGYRSGSSLNKYEDYYIWYWTATSTDGTNMQKANAMTNNNTSAKPSTTNAQSRLYGMPVRLVRDVN